MKLNASNSRDDFSLTKKYVFMILFKVKRHNLPFM